MVDKKNTLAQSKGKKVEPLIQIFKSNLFLVGLHLNLMIL